MRKILFVALGATLLAAGCQKTEIINPVNPTGQPALSFTTDLGKLTKAVGTADADSDGMVNLKAQDFRVWAYADYEDPNTTTVELDNIYDKMANLNIGYSEKEVTTDEGKTMVGSWAPAKEYYWPGVGKDLRFFAVSGVALGEDLSATSVVVPTITRTTTVVTSDDPNTESNEEVTETNVAMKLEVKDFVVNHAAPNADLMVADFVHQNQANKEVALKFRHALAKVEFLFNTLADSDAKVYVQNLKVEKVMTKSTLTVTENAGDDKATKPTVFTWATPTIEQTFEDDYKGTAAVPEDTERLDATVALDMTARELTTTAENFCTWLVMPQTISTLQVKITYVIGKRQFESIFPLAATNLTAWGANQYVRYTITLAPNKISFNPSVEEWDQFDANATENGKQDITMQN